MSGMHDEMRPARLATPGAFAGYNNPRSHFARRLAVVQASVRETLDAMPPGDIVVVDICAGVGNALLPILVSHRRRSDVHAWLIELDAESAQQARETIRDQALPGVRVVEADAGLSDSYVGLPRAHLVIISGVFAHLSNADRVRTLRFLPEICAPDATLIWTIGIRWDPRRVARLRRFVREASFSVIALRSVTRWQWGGMTRHEVGVARLACAPEVLVPGARLFVFRPTVWERFPLIRRLTRPVLRRIRQSLKARIG